MQLACLCFQDSLLCLIKVILQIPLLHIVPIIRVSLNQISRSLAHPYSRLYVIHAYLEVYLELILLLVEVEHIRSHVSSVG